MAFKKAQPGSTVPDSPDELLRDLPRRKIPDVLPHQREIMRSYAASAIKEKDVALQLPTGSGKTLVGLLIAEWQRRKNGERVLYLCTTKQLVNQVVEQGGWQALSRRALTGCRTRRFYGCGFRANLKHDPTLSYNAPVAPNSTPRPLLSQTSSFSPFFAP